MEAFDLTAPLPGTGITVLEASAGTGKTFTLAALATRFIAEGARLDELLLITFSRAATQELRDRVREQLVAAAAELALPEATTPLGGVLRRDADRRELDDASIEVRRRRLLDAVAHYDAATIATTHEFCHAVLRSLGVAGNSDARETLREDLSGLTDDVVTDHYLARWSGTAEPPVTFKEARIAAENALAQPHAALRPRDFDQDSREAALVSFAGGVRDEVAHRKQRAAILTFDDLLDRLATALEGEDSAAAERMRARWKVILVDEFQDTDPVQWQVLSRAFSGHVHRAGPHRRPQAGDLRLPRRRHRRPISARSTVPRPARSTAITDPTRRSSTPCRRCCVGLSWATSRSWCIRSPRPGKGVRSPAPSAASTMRSGEECGCVASRARDSISPSRRPFVRRTGSR
jgi:ATP-dependent exoDNAse (exonuclease V) beta subunit